MKIYDDYTHAASPGIIQFENANEGRSYPFADNTQLISSDGSVLDDNVVADMHLVIPERADAYVSNVYVSRSMVSLCVRIVRDGSLFAAMSCTVEAKKFEPFVPYRLEKLHGSEDVGGIVTFGIIDFAAESGTYRFDDNRVKLSEAAVSRYVPAKLRSIIDDRNGKSLRGDVKINFSGYVDASKSGRTVSLKLLPGAATALLSKCDREVPINPCGATPIMMINGVRADSKDRIVIWFH